MQLIVSGHHIEVTEGLRDHVAAKFEKLQKHIVEYKDKLVYENLQAYIDMMNSSDGSHRLPELKEYLTNLEKLRPTNYKETFKELIDLGLFEDE